MGIRDHEVRNDTPTSRKVDWHSFRRAFATALAEAGTNEQPARLLVAHGDASVYAKYVQQTRVLTSLQKRGEVNAPVVRRSRTTSALSVVTSSAWPSRSPS